jgi:DNA-binding NarL/FixJ family response regulator
LIAKIKHRNFVGLFKNYSLMIRVAVFDDNPDRLESLKLLLSRDSELYFVGGFADGVDAVTHVAAAKPDVVLMDIEMPGVGGVMATKAIKAAFPHVVVLMQTVYEDDDNLFRSIQAGATGYILKRTNPDRILDAIKDAYRGGAPITPTMAYKVLRFFQTANTVITTDYGISEREKRILKCLVDGMSYKMIAENEGLSYHTVNSHVRNIYDKLHVHSMSEAVSKALKEDLLK